MRSIITIAFLLSSLIANAQNKDQDTRDSTKYWWANDNIIETTPHGSRIITFSDINKIDTIPCIFHQVVPATDPNDGDVLDNIRSGYVIVKPFNSVKIEYQGKYHYVNNYGFLYLDRKTKVTNPVISYIEL